MSDAPIVERVARAICRATYRSSVNASEIDEVVNAYWADWIPEARASILAMREPTLEMVEAGRIKYCTKEQTRRLWAAMIDEALREQP
jgi:hypothetical protein